MTKKISAIYTACIVLLVVALVCLIIVNLKLKQENDYLNSGLEGVFRKADKNEYFLNDGLYYMDGDTGKCFFKIDDGHIHLVFEDKERFRDMYKTEVTDKYTPDNTHYKEFDEWVEYETELWKYPKEYTLVYNALLNPDDVCVGYDFTFDDNMSVSSYLSLALYVDSDSIEYQGVGEPIIFTRVE
ncbi:MAG: hypothetical protein NC078_11920 [Ruminococcus sp.]|nr:hypothetical protein [Ruminococcus sp.]